MNKGIEISISRRETLIRDLRQFFSDELDQDLSDFQAERLLDHAIETLGAAVYNQAVQDVRAHLQTKLDDMDGEVYAVEKP